MEIRKVLVSVTDKTGLEKLKPLHSSGLWEFISTGGTAKELEKLGIPCTSVEEVTNFPEMLNGRLKTLHPKIFGGILADRSKHEHMESLYDHGIDPIDLVIVNLYDFGGKPGIENVDIGGPSLIRAAAKNAATVTVVVDPDDYEEVVEQLLTNRQTTSLLRAQLAQKVFAITAEYNTAIAQWIASELGAGRNPFEATTAPSGH